MEPKQSPKGQVTFKPYPQHQLMLLPPNLEELITPNHLVRVVNQVVDRLDLRTLEKAYPGGGASNYHPKMMLKVLIYAYCTKIYSSRKIDRALQESIHFMWLSGMQQPDFRTINNFRVGPLKTLIDEVFNQVLFFLIENQYVRLEHYFVDGTKLRADAYKYSYVWAKNTDRYKKGVEEKIKELLKQIDAENEREQAEYGDKHLEEFGEESPLSSEQIRKKAEQINEKLKKNPPGGKSQRKQQSQQRKLQQYADKLAKYEKQESILKGRSSYSKTDHDATFMRMKDDQLLPGYNVINGTENQFIINYTISQSAAEQRQFVTHMDQLKVRTKGWLPNTVTTDAGFGSEQNYDYLSKEQIGNYVKYSGYYYEQTKKYRDNPFHKDHFEYDKQSDTFTCPNGQQLPFKKQTIKRNANGYPAKIRVYQSLGCGGCPYASLCKKGNADRIIKFSPRFEAYKQQIRDNFNTPEGQKMKKRRGWDVETPFADIKHNQNYRRFRLRGIKKVHIEWGLLSISHNIRKLAIARA